MQVKDPNNPTKQKEDRELIKFTGPADSVYLKARDYVELDVGTGECKSACCKLQPCLSQNQLPWCLWCGTGAAVSISSSGWEDVVVVSKSHSAVQPYHGITLSTVMHLALV